MGESALLMPRPITEADMEAMAAMVAAMAMESALLMPRPTTVVDMEDTEAIVAVMAAAMATESAPLMLKLTTEVDTEAIVAVMAAMAMESDLLMPTTEVDSEATMEVTAVVTATESNFTILKTATSSANLLSDSQTVLTDLKLLYHELNQFEIQFSLSRVVT